MGNSWVMPLNGGLFQYETSLNLMFESCFNVSITVSIKLGKTYLNFTSMNLAPTLVNDYIHAQYDTNADVCPQAFLRSLR